MAKRIVTQEDLDLNPELVEQGINIGDEFEFADDAAGEEQETGGEGGEGVE